MGNRTGHENTQRRENPALRALRGTREVPEGQMGGLRTSAERLALGQPGRHAPSLRRLHGDGRGQASGAVATGHGAG